MRFNRNDSGQVYSTGILHSQGLSAIGGRGNGMTSPHINLYESASTTPHVVVTSSPVPRRRVLAMGSYILGWLRPTEPVYPSSRPSLYLTVPWRFRFVPASAWPRLGGAVDAGSCHAGSLSRGGDTLGIRSGPRRNRSGVLKARVIVVPP